MNVRDAMRRAAGFQAEATAVVVGERRLSYAAAWERGLRMANLLLGRGLRPGDRVAVLEDNTVEAVDVLLGATAANLVRVPLYARSSVDSHVHMLQASRARFVVVGRKHLGQAADLESVAGVEHVIQCDAGYESALAAAPATDPDVSVADQDLHVIRFTGGTSGQPKGVANTHQQWMSAARDIFYSFPPPGLGDGFLHAGPISHGSGYFFLPIWLHGGVNHLMERFDAGLALRLIEAERIRYTLLLPTMVQAMVNHEDAMTRDLSSLRVVDIGSAPIADATILRARKVFGDVLCQAYGGTELPVGTFMDSRLWFAEIPGSTPLRSAGRPLPWTEARILREDGSWAEPGEAGSVALRAESQMTGYLDNPEATAEAVVNGFVLTGDIGQIDANGFLYILDRRDDMITSGGFHLWPAELENVIAGHPAVLEVAVVAIPDDYWGEIPLAICVLAPGAEATEEEVIELCGQRLGSYRKPRRVVFREEPLPKSSIGKVLRKQLREPYWAGQGRRIGAS